jgi:hypothetical protein
MAMRGRKFKGEPTRVDRGVLLRQAGSKAVARDYKGVDLPDLFGRQQGSKRGHGRAFAPLGHGVEELL